MLSTRVRRGLGAVTALALVGSTVLVAVVAVGGGTRSGGPALAGLGSAQPPAAVFLGDSITLGNSDLAAGRLGELSWFTGLVAGPRPTLRFAGGIAENGRTTDWMAQQAGAALRLRPDVLVVLGGTNDVSAGVPVQESLDNLRTLAAACRSAGVAMAVATIPPHPDRAEPAAALNDGIRELARDEGLVLVDLAAALGDGTGDWADPSDTVDGIHPSPAGAARMAAAAEAALQAAT